MNTKRFLLGALAVFVFIHLAEFVFHGMILSGNYDQHANLMRPDAEMSSTMPLMSIGFLILAVGFSYIFVQGYRGTGIAEGVRFGFFAGITFGLSSNLINYSVMPWPGSWPLLWTIGETLIMMIAGGIIAAIYNKPLSR